MNDKQLMEALKKIGIELKYGDRERLSLEIDTQKIRNDDNTFNYRDFFIKANVMVGEPQRRNRSKETGGLTQTEIREALDTIKEIREELTYRKKDLHEVFNIKKDDHDIDFKEIRFGLQDHLDSVGDRIANSKRKMTSLKNYL